MKLKNLSLTVQALIEDFILIFIDIQSAMIILRLTKKGH